VTDSLIASLAQDLKPVRQGAVARRIVLTAIIGFIVSALVMIVWLGLRPDLATAIATPIFWVKFGYTLAVGFFGLLALDRLARPDGRAGAPLIAVFAAFSVIALFSIVQMVIAAGDARHALIFGSSALRCPFYIFALSMPFLVANIIALRRLAPTHLPMAGLGAGLMAGALGAWVYSFHCTEEALPFLAIWYSLGIAAVAALGAAIGRFVLRW